MNYFNIRKLHYKTQRKIHLTMNVSIDDWFFSPYHCLKVRFFIDLSALFVFFLQYTPIKPNLLSVLYVVSGIVGALLLGSTEENLIIAGVIIFFLYGIFDWMDGLLARVTKKMSTLGSVLDPWSGYVGSFSFLIGLGLYLFNATQEMDYLIDNNKYLNFDLNLEKIFNDILIKYNGYALNKSKISNYFLKKNSFLLE